MIKRLIASCILLTDGNVVEVRITGRDGALGVAIGTGERPSLTSAEVRLAGEASAVDYPCLQTTIDRSAALRASLARYDAFQQAMADQSVAWNAVDGAKAQLVTMMSPVRRSIM